MYDQFTADLIAERTKMPTPQDLFDSDLRCARRAGMTESAAGEYAQRLALHPSRGAVAPAGALAILVGLWESDAVAADKAGDLPRYLTLRACIRQAIEALGKPQTDAGDLLQRLVDAREP